MNMTNFSAAFPLDRVPRPHDPEMARAARERWCEAVLAEADADLERRAQAALGDTGTARLLDAVFAFSPFLSAAAERDAGFLLHLLSVGADQAREEVMAEVAQARAEAIDGADPSRPLRVAKRRLALTAALADITGAWPLEEVTGALSDFADAALDCAADHLLAEAGQRGVLELPDPEAPGARSGLIILGMGKLGARELNYSSDIDLIVFYDTDRIDTKDPDRLQRHFVRLVHSLVRLMEQRTADGYVFRTDLRLRPDPSITPPALSVLAAETYYESLGQNWERAAFIKARPVAGDREAGEALLHRLRPFIWRKHLDFAAIQDIHSIKRQINAHRGGSRIAVGGHNIKLGRGGIREIEFFAQTQQLIWGGRVPELRAISTVAALQALVAHGQTESATAESLIAAYRFLRRLEHRIQMIHDEQTHQLPKRSADLAHVAAFFGATDLAGFEAEVLTHLRAVEKAYGALFDDAPTLSLANGAAGNLVFTGDEADPETMETLRHLGFSHPGTVDTVVRTWHRGRYRATRSTRARQILTELMPLLLKALADTPDPDAALLTFDRFLAGLPAGVQVFSLFHANPPVLALVAEIMGGAPRLAARLAGQPSLLESVVMPDFFDAPPGIDDLTSELDAALIRAEDPQDVLDLMRRWANDRKFQVGVQELRCTLAPALAALAYSNIAEVSIRTLLARVEDDFARDHGRVAGCDMAVIAMGKLGGREMTATSDLDLIFVYTTPDEGAASDGRRSLSASHYFARLSQRFINAVTAPTPEGTLYEVDMRLRPSGRAGPIAVSFAAFERYQRDDAWTWERMALTRARAVAGPAALVVAIEQVIGEVLKQERDEAALVRAVADMRLRMDAEHHTDSIWEVKHIRGGLVDVEFIAQYLQLRHAHQHPGVLATGTAEALERCRDAELLDDDTAATLLEAFKLWQAVQGRIRLTLSGAISARGADDAPEALRRSLRPVEAQSVSELVERMHVLAGRVREIYHRLIDRPAGVAADRPEGEPG
ncbi:MAG: bifunctional [glutamine synthetase] adenylyltransferase/[glutamine synthetase]-adenylyl-L-tyrosine phosphorylase [Rhodospirillales bacterium]|nr:MAG: bifunctional [glutamine synthetase] adenylyltransferase/[glutamine synthetase]-adenylyl-L-tyrosine phosphorylase [Rhodospirillales bacterium]